MSFNFEWPEFSESFYEDAREMLAQVSPLASRGRSPPEATRDGETDL